MNDLIHLFFNLVFISIITVGGGAQALLENLAVHQTGWLTASEFATGLSLAFLTPGPNILLTPVFIGYKVGGVFGSLVGLVGIFISPAILAGFASKYTDKFLHHPWVHAFEQGARSALIGLLLITTLNIYEQVEQKWIYTGITIVVFWLSLKKVNPALVLIGGVFVGSIISFIA